MIKFINTKTGNVYMGEKPYIHWFPGAQSVGLIYTMPIMMISDVEEFPVELDSEVFSLLDINRAFKSENDITLNNIKYTNFNKLKVSNLLSKGEPYVLDEDTYYIHCIYISALSDIIAECIQSIFIDNVEYYIGADFYNENENLEILMKNFGINLPKSIQRAFLPTNIYEEQQDNIILNRKFKELLSNYWDIIANKGSYKSLINSLKWFEWGDLVKMNELWVRKNGDKIRYEERSLTDFLTDKYKNTLYGFSKTTLTTLRAALQQIQSADILGMDQTQFDENDNPVLYDIVTKWSKKDLVLKMTLLANFYETYFMPIHVHLFQATVEDIIFTNNFKTYLDTANHKEEYFLDVNDFKCVINNNDPIYISNVSTGVDLDTLFANHYKKSETNYDDHVIVGVKDLKNVKFTNKKVNGVEIDIDKTFWVQNYNGMGALVPVKCVLDMGKTNDFVKFEQISINFDKDGIIKEFETEINLYDDYEENDYIIEDEEPQEEISAELYNYITINDYKIYESKLNEEDGHYYVEIDFNLLCKNHSQENVNMTLRFDTAGGQTFVKKTTFKVEDYTNTSLDFYRVERKMYNDNGELNESDWNGKICNNYILMNNNLSEEYLDQFNTLKYRQFMPSKNPTENELIIDKTPEFEVLNYELKAIDSIDDSEKFEIQKKDIHNFTIINKESIFAEKCTIYIPIDETLLRSGKLVKCSFKAIPKYNQNSNLENKSGELMINCMINHKDLSWNYIGSYEGTSYAGNIVEGSNSITFDGYMNDKPRHELYLILYIESPLEIIWDEIKISDLNIEYQTGGIALNNILVLDNNELRKDSVNQKYIESLMNKNYFITNKKGFGYDYLIGVSKKFWYNPKDFDVWEEMNCNLQVSENQDNPNLEPSILHIKSSGSVDITSKQNLQNNYIDPDNPHYLKLNVIFNEKINIKDYFSVLKMSIISDELNPKIKVYYTLNQNSTKQYIDTIPEGNIISAEIDMSLIDDIKSIQLFFEAIDIYDESNNRLIIKDVTVNSDVFKTQYRGAKKAIYRNDYGFFPEFHELVPFGKNKEISGNEIIYTRSDNEDEYIVKDNDVVCVIPKIDYLGGSIPFNYTSMLSEGSNWEFKNHTTGKVYKFNHIQQPYILSDDEEMEPGYYGVTFNYSTTDTSKIHSLNYGHVFFKQ